ncbi:MAG TPA: ATP-binding protein [Thermoleophilaceae bacterium]
MSEIDPAELARAFTRLSKWAHDQAEAEPEREPVIRVRLREHLGAEPAELPVVSTPLRGYERVNFQVALDAWLEADGHDGELVGLSAMQGFRVGLAELAQPARGQFGPPLPEPGAPEWEPVEVGERRISCVRAGLWLLAGSGEPFVLMLAREDDGPGDAELGIEVMAGERERAEAFIAELRELMDRHNVYRGRVLELSESQWGGAGLRVRRLPRVEHERIVLGGGILERIERHTELFTTHAEELRQAGRHLRRGLLLHGPPGTGKTLTAMYLATLMPERTTFLLTGHGFGAIGLACEIARTLTPAMIVLEDVDLVAMDRDAFEDTNALLFELLNEMDGLNEDADVVFVLTTNRPQVLERALAARPGRIDLAVRMPLPDAEARGRLLDLYAEGLEVGAADRARIVETTDGATPAFIRELLRRAALLAAEAGDARRIGAELLDRALAELHESGDELTGRLLGAPGAADFAESAVVIDVFDEDEDDFEDDEDLGDDELD